MSDEMIPQEPDIDLIQAIEELKSRREPWYSDRWLIGTCGAIIGALFMYVARQPEIDHYKNAPLPARAIVQNSHPVPSSANPGATATSPMQPSSQAAPTSINSKATDANSSDSPSATPEKPSAATRPTTVHKEEGKPDTESNRQRPPMNPLINGDIGLTKDPGALPPIGQAGTLPSVVPATDTLPGLTVSGSGGAGAGVVLASIARKFGGGIKKYEEYTGRDKSSIGYIVWVPEKNSRAFLEKLKSSSGIDISDQVQGSGDDRNRIFTEGLRTILARLTKQRADLLIKYYEDAPSVKEIDGQIAEVNKSISTMRTPGAGYAVAKIETS